MNRRGSRARMNKFEGRNLGYFWGRVCLYEFEFLRSVDQSVIFFGGFS